MPGGARSGRNKFERIKGARHEAPASKAAPAPSHFDSGRDGLAPPSAAATKLTAGKRLALFALMAWSTDYTAHLSAEQELNSDVIESLRETWSSTYSLAMLRAGGPGATRIFDRMNDNSGNLRRSKSVRYIPFSQAIKGVSYLYSTVSRVQWDRERAMRRVVGRSYATQLLDAMADCRPPPEWELSSFFASIAFDQTYTRAAGAGVGTSAYRSVQGVNPDGSQRDREQVTYINGQDYAVPAFAISAAALALLTASGPYTQDFARLYPHLQPDRVDRVMDDLLVRAVGLVGAAHQAGRRTVGDVLRALLSRPNHDPGGGTYTTYILPLLNCDTKAYTDMVRIIDWMHHHLGGIPVVLQVIGDGQSVLRMRDLKRLYPDTYQHVLVSNGHFHSSAHFQFAVCTMWWLPLLCFCCSLLGKTMVGPDIKNLVNNTFKHTYDALMVVTIAIFVYFIEHVTEPPPELFFSNPVLYISLISANVSGTVLAEFLRHGGIPTMFWKRSARAQDGATVDDLHCLAFHLVPPPPHPHPTVSPPKC